MTVNWKAADHLLIREWKKGAHQDDIAVMIGCSPGAVIVRASVLRRRGVDLESRLNNPVPHAAGPKSSGEIIPFPIQRVVLPTRRWDAPALTINYFDACQYMHGDPSKRHFCGAPTKQGSPYCEKHHKRCYIPLPLS